jgi:hypothetical protein
MFDSRRLYERLVRNKHRKRGPGSQKNQKNEWQTDEWWPQTQNENEQTDEWWHQTQNEETDEWWPQTQNEQSNEWWYHSSCWT